MSSQTFKTVQFKPNAPLFKEGDSADFAYIIKKGSVKIYKRGPSGQNVPIALAEKGSIVGEMAIISDAPRSASVVAQDEVEAIAVSKDSFENRLKDIDPFLHSLIKTVISRLRKTSDHTVALYEKVKSYKVANTPRAQQKTKQFKPSFKHVNFMLADPNPQTRNGLRGGLFGEGFREITDISYPNQIAESLDKSYYDLLILDSSFGSATINRLIHNIRHGKHSKNPFISIMILTENPSQDYQQSLLHSGCDLVLQKPVSIKNVMDGIMEMCTNRRPYVITHDYAGPDRPNYKPLLSKDAPFIDAPNTLCAKVLNGFDDQKVHKDIEAGLVSFNEIKMERNLVQLAWMLENMSPEEGTTPHNLDYILDSFDHLLDDLAKRAYKSRFGGSAHLCKGMRELVQTYKNDTNSNSQHWQDMNVFYKELVENIPLLTNTNATNDMRSAALN